MSRPREDEHLEFKEAKQSFDREKALGYCCALANEGGGKLVLGVTDKAPRQIVGTQAFRDIQDIQTTIFNKFRFRVDVEELATTNGRVVVFHVPGRHRGAPVELDGRYLMRNGESLVPMTNDVLRAIYSEGDGDWALRPASDSVDDAEVIALLNTQSYFDLAKLPYPSTREAVINKLSGERLIQREEGGLWNVTNLGALLFAKRLDAFDLLARRAPRVIVYKGTNKVETQREQIGKTGYAVGFERLLEYVNGQIPSNEVVTQAIRKDVKMFPAIAVRELVANALIHQDFEQRGGILIEIYSNRLEVSNPGKPMIETDRFIDEYRSRSDRIADLARRLGMCEEKGSGIDKVVHTAEVYQLPAPDFVVDSGRTTAILFALRPFDDLDREERVRACYQHCCLRYVTREAMTNQSLRQRFQLSDQKMATVSRVISDAVDAGKIRLEDPASGRKFSKYIPFWA